MTDSDDLQELVEGKDSKILAREIGKTQELIDEMKKSVEGKLDTLPCEEHEDRLDDLEEYREGQEAVQEHQHQSKLEFYWDWKIKLMAIGIFLSVVLSILGLFI